MEARSDADLTAFSGHLRRRSLDGESLDSLLVEAFALVREVSRRKLGKAHYDVQLIGGIVLHEGSVAEMGTGAVRGHQSVAHTCRQGRAEKDGDSSLMCALSSGIRGGIPTQACALVATAACARAGIRTSTC